jgi:hypothetical protein
MQPDEVPDYEWTHIQNTHRAQGIQIDRKTAATRWRGERMDYDLGVWVLCNQKEAARKAGGVPRARDWDNLDLIDPSDVSAETS